MPMFLPDYNCTSIHKLMLGDRVRTSSYCKAIGRQVTAGDIVVDLGCGTGILSLAAARAGARRVYALEMTRIALVAKRIIGDNNLQDVIQVIHQDSRSTELAEKADLLVSEWMGVHVLQENMLPALCDARKRLLRPGGRIIPEKVTLWLAPIRRNPILADEVIPWNSSVEGFSFSEMMNLALNDTYIARMRPEELTHGGCPVLEIDLYDVEPAEQVEVCARFWFERPEVVEGLCGWFVTDLTKDVVLDTAPSAPATHWQQAVYPCYPSLQVSAGECLEARVVFENGLAHVDTSWSLAVVDKGVCHEYSTKKNYTVGRGCADQQSSNQPRQTSAGGPAEGMCSARAALADTQSGPCEDMALKPTTQNPRNSGHGTGG